MEPRSTTARPEGNTLETLTVTVMAVAPTASVTNFDPDKPKDQQ